MYSLVIAEDELMTRRGLVDMIKWNEMGFTVDREFSDGQELLDYLKGSMPDVILTDIKMSRVSGVDIARFVAERGLPIQIVFLSGYKDFEFAQSAVEYRVFRYLVKPVSIPKLREVFLSLKESLDRRNSFQSAMPGQSLPGEQVPGTGNQAGHPVPCAQEPDAPGQEPEAAYEQNATAIETVMKFIRQHFCEDISLSDIAGKVFLNPIYISRLIKEQTGKNYTELLTEMRVGKAVELLEQTNLYVYEIADRVGYHNLKYFYKVFKKATGGSPNDYRPKRN